MWDFQVRWRMDGLHFSLMAFGALQVALSQVNGSSNASHYVYLRDIRIRIFSCAILRRFVRKIAVLAISKSCMRITVAARSASRKVGTFVLDDLLKYIVQDRFRIIWVIHRSGDSEDITTFSDVVLDIFVVALVCELCEFNPTQIR